MKGKKTSGIFIAIIILLIGLAACKKENKVPTKLEIITGNSWKMSAMNCNPAITVSSMPFGVSDIYPFLPECIKDNYTDFYTNSTFISYEGALKCDSASADSYSGTWSFSSDETSITFSNFNGVEGTFTFVIDEITKDKISLRQTLNSIGDLAIYTDTTGLSSMITMQPNTKLTLVFVPK
ncbi:MAG: hypothetical protein A2275_10435 [Bacteroidetes bacterium RIFOXYA12_FULL_35_11]|nr:MAG: hypothetical protein A2X01_18710 [Bacteroidetes bacterium GWF2_35_48]OFY75477.1 MAG: hypothetical protein A2275_10435 [Bacteroidetes bacterium RIFOXYA12_FULL_35_11]HBX53343.1 hypothetical protein [Bacteroidales bacterium]